MNVFNFPKPVFEAAGEGAPAAGAAPAPGGQAGDAAPQGGGTFFKAGDGGDAKGDGAKAGAAQGAGEGTPKAVDGAPDWLIGRFAMIGEDGTLDVNASMQKQAEGYSDLYRSYSKKTDTLRGEIKQEMAGEFAAEYAKERGVPEDPKDYAYPESVNPPGEEIDQSLRAWAKENNIGADAFQQLINDVWLPTMPDFAAEAAKLGKNEQEITARLEPLNKWITANFDADQVGAIERVMQTADGVMFMEKVAKMVSPSGFAPDAGQAQQATELTRASIREKQADPRFGDDDNYTAMVRGLWAKYAALPPEQQR